MKRYFRTVFVLCCCIVPALPAFAADEIAWISDYDEAIRQARETGKPILLAFRCVP